MKFFAKDWKKKFPFFETYYEELPDWFLHFLNFGFLAYVMRSFKTTIGTIILATIFNFAYECKDTMFRWEKIGRFGGDGFSIKDFLFAEAGIFAFVLGVCNFAEWCVWGIVVLYLLGISYKSLFPTKTFKA